MKRIYYGYCDYSCSTIFLNAERELIGNVDENDGEWRDEYFNPIFKKVFIEIVEINFNKVLSKYQTELEEQEIQMDDINFKNLTLHYV